MSEHNAISRTCNLLGENITRSDFVFDAFKTQWLPVLGLVAVPLVIVFLYGMFTKKLEEASFWVLFLLLLLGLLGGYFFYQWILFGGA